jgi:hypothetical protein
MAKKKTSVEKENRDNKQRTIFEMLWGGPGGIGS